MSIIDSISKKLQEPLPGHNETLKFVRQKKILFSNEPDHTTRSSAVLILLYPKKDSLFVPLILRPKYDGYHGGQISLPGGKKETIDESLTRTALREAQEEVGIKASDVQVLGSLTEVFINVSNYMVQPIIGFMPYEPIFYPDAKEVDRIYEMPLEKLKDNSLITTKPLMIKNTEVIVDGFYLEDQWVWGATALILAELRTLLKTI